MAVTIKRFIVVLISFVLFFGASWLGVTFNRTKPLEWTNDALMPWEKDAFDQIGNQGIKTNVTLSELEGDYRGEVVCMRSKMVRQSFEGRGIIVGNHLSLFWVNAQNETITLSDLDSFSLKTGIVQIKPYQNTGKPRIFGVIKVYPSQHMLDIWLENPYLNVEGIIAYETWHFQMIKQ